MNKIDEALGTEDKVYTSNEYLGSTNPCNIRMWKLNENSKIVEGLCVVTPSSIENAMVVDNNSTENLKIVQIDKIVDKSIEQIQQMVEQIFGIADAQIVDYRLRLHDTFSGERDFDNYLTAFNDNVTFRRLQYFIDNPSSPQIIAIYGTSQDWEM